MKVRGYYLLGSENNFRSIFPGLLISAVSHVLIAVIFLYAPGRQLDKRILSPIHVSLVSMPEPYRGPYPPKGRPSIKTPEKTAAVAPKTETVKTPLKTDSVHVPEPAVKASLKKKTFKTGEVVKNIPEKEKKAEENKTDALSKALKEMEKKVQSAEKSDSFAKTLERMKQSVEKSQTRDRERPGDPSGVEGATAGGGGSPGELTPIDAYKLEIMSLIEQNWAFSPQMAGRLENLESVIIIKVMANGEVKDVWFEKKSGNEHLDESAHKAILKSNPLPPLPSGYTRPFLTVGIMFTPTGVQQ